MATKRSKGKRASRNGSLVKKQGTRSRSHPNRSQSGVSGDRRPWTNREIEFLKEAFQPERAAETAKILNRPVEVVDEKAAELNVCHDRPWTDWDLRQITADYNEMGLPQLAKRLCRTPGAVKIMAHRLTEEGRLENKVGPLPRWRPDEIAILKQSKDAPLPELAQKLGRTERAILWKQQLLGLSDPLRTYWTTEEEAYLNQSYRTQTVSELARHLKRTRHSVLAKMRRLGLSKSG